MPDRYDHSLDAMVRRLASPYSIGWVPATRHWAVILTEADGKVCLTLSDNKAAIIRCYVSLRDQED